MGSPWLPSSSFSKTILEIDLGTNTIWWHHTHVLEQVREAKCLYFTLAQSWGNVGERRGASSSTPSPTLERERNLSLSRGTSNNLSRVSERNLVSLGRIRMVCLKESYATDPRSDGCTGNATCKNTYLSVALYSSRIRTTERTTSGRAEGIRIEKRVPT